MLLRMARGSRGRRALRRWRESESPRVTQEALGRAVGVSGSAIRHFENGTGTEGFDLSLPVKVKLGQHTGLSLSVLLRGDELDTVVMAAGLLRDGASVA